MKKLGVKLGAILLSTSFLLAGCGSTSKDDSAKKDDGKIKVVASFYPMYDFVKKIGGDKVEVKDMVPAGTEPHDWEPSPKDLVELQDANVFVYNGAGMESWVNKVKDSVKNDKLVTVEASKGIKLIKGEHEHEHEDEEKGHDHKDAEKGHDHEEGEFDPHVWLAPENAKLEMKNIMDALIKVSPDDKEYFEKNYEDYSKKLDELNDQYKSELSKTKKKDIIVAHQAFGYLCEAYGLKQVPIEGLSPDSEPDAARMAELADFAKKNDVKYIFFEELVSPKVAKSLAKEVGAKAEVLNPIEGLTEEQIKDGQDYFSIMNQNLAVLVKALQ